MPRTTAKYKEAVKKGHNYRLPMGETRNKEELYELLHVNGFFWDSKAQKWEHHEILAGDKMSQPDIHGFSSTQAFILPIETWYLVHENLTKSEMKVMFCVLLNYFQVGIDSEPLTFSDILKQTKLSKSSVSSGLEAAIVHGYIIRTLHQNQPHYEPRFKKIRTHDMTCTLDTCQEGEPPKEKYKTCHGSEIEPRQEIFAKLLKFGLAHHVAQNISMTSRYPLKQLQNQIKYIEHEIETGDAPANLRSFPGYVVNRIKYDRQKPPSFKSDPLDDNWVR